MTPPNILFILIDDLGWRDLACYGSTFYETPNIDRLAAQGMRFTNAYAASPVCSPTRASILSGKYPARVGVTDWIGAHTHGKLIDAPYIDHLPLDEYTLAQALRASDYQTWHVGKWHLGGKPYYPENQGFDINIAGCHWGYPNNGYFSPWGIPTLSDGSPGEYLGDRLTDEAIRLIEKRENRPFFLNLWFYDVHTPIQAKSYKVEKYRQKVHDQHLDELLTFQPGDFFPCEHKKDQHILRRLVQSDVNYAAMIESLDDNIGRIYDTLDRQGIGGDTVVIFTSDNGGLATSGGSPTCNAPLAEGKGWLYEGGTREPLLVSWPGVIRPGSTGEIPLNSPDFYPTLLDIVGVPFLPDQQCDGKSFWSILNSTPGTDYSEWENRPIFWHYPHYGNQGGTPGSSVRVGHYKLIEFFEDNHLELYNLEDDPSEKQNLAGDDLHRTREFFQILLEWRESVKAIIPKPYEANP